MLELLRIGHSYGPRMVLRDISLSLREGQAVAIVGPSGVGKSTLLSIIGGFIKPDTGSVENPHSNPALILQSHHALPSRTVLENTMLYCRIDKGEETDSRRRAMVALDLVGLSSLHQARARALSGGELQRVAVARSMASSRRLILADEPTSNLDFALSRQVMKALFASAGRRTVVVVTHDLESLPPGAEVLRLTGTSLVRIGTDD